MPELPEVETSRRGIAPSVVGHVIKQVIVRQPKLRWPVAPEVIALREMQVQGLTRRGKYLLFDFTTGQMLVHLGMSGSLRVVPTTTPPGKHDHVDWLLDSGCSLRLTDPRRFGAVLWNTQGAAHPLLAHLGVEPLGDAFDGAHLQRQAQGRQQAVKPFLMDANRVVGVGNIYAQESLFMAGVHPARQVNRISAVRWQAIATAVRTVLEKSIAVGGTSLRDFLHADGKPGYFRQELQVYGRAGEPCYRCGALIRQIRQGQRSTCYCPHCQT